MAKGIKKIFQAKTLDSKLGQRTIKKNDDESMISKIFFNFSYNFFFHFFGNYTCASDYPGATVYIEK